MSGWERWSSGNCARISNLTIQTNPESTLKNETHKRPWDFEIQTDHIISTRRPDLMIVNKKSRGTWWIVEFAVLADHRVKLKEREKIVKYLELARELKKLWNTKVTAIPFVIGTLCIVTKGLVQGLEDLEITGQVENIQITEFIKISQYPVKSPRNLRRLTVTQTPVRNEQPKLVGKNLKRVK